MITVFTPTYNRRKLLERCYKSLLNQTDYHFEWLIVDDGSSDDTKSWINTIKSKSPFKIIYHYQTNGGKHRAHNTGVKLCKTEYFLILDSDDILANNCIEVLNSKIENIDNNDLISGILGNKFDINTKKCIGTPLPDIKYSTGLNLYQKYNFKGDTLRMYKTSILKKYLFPEIENEKFVYENVVFDKIDTKYKFYLIKDEIYYCEYQENGYTKGASKLKLNNPKGYALSLKSAADTAVVLKKKINWTVLYIIWCRKMKIKDFGMTKNKALYLLLYPIALLFEYFKFPKFFFSIFKEVK